MGQPAARIGDKVLQSGPHCHAPMHPAALVPTPAPHPPMPLPIISGSPNVTIAKMPAARVTDQTQPCLIPVCVPGGPGRHREGFGDRHDQQHAGGSTGRFDHASCLCRADPRPLRNDHRTRRPHSADRRLRPLAPPPFRGVRPDLPELRRARSRRAHLSSSRTSPRKPTEMWSAAPCTARCPRAGMSFQSLTAFR